MISTEGLSYQYEKGSSFSFPDIACKDNDKLLILGKSGVGKTTLLKVLTGEIAPDTGTVTHGTNLEMAVFDQTRAALASSDSWAPRAPGAKTWSGTGFSVWLVFALTFPSASTSSKSAAAPAGLACSAPLGRSPAM